MSALKFKPFVPSQKQSDFFGFVEGRKGSCVLIAVAGSGKSTTILRSLVKIPEHERVLVLAFNAAIVKEAKASLELLKLEMGRDFRNVRIMTFHGLGFGAVLKRLNRKVDPSGNKLRDLTRELWGEETRTMYATFCCDLVSIAKGQGVGVLCADETFAWRSLIDHHDLTLESEEASIERAIELSRELLEHSNERAKVGIIDYDDMLYLPLLWKLSLFQQDRIYVDEAQDTNPVRRALAKKALRPGGFLYAVGDPRQAIYGFTGASHDAIDLIRKEFNAVELPLTVSYRCPKAVGTLAREIVPYFEVHEGNEEGEVRRGVGVADTLKLLGNHDAILCRNVAPLVELAYHIISKGRACHVLGSEIGRGLAALVKKMNARTIDDVTAKEEGKEPTAGLVSKLQRYRDREVEAYMAKGEERKAEGVSDRVACLLTFVDALKENERTISKLLGRIEDLFSDSNGVLTLSTCHKAKGREWNNVAVWCQELMPSPWARQDWQYEQERNLMYVRDTRARKTLTFMRDDIGAK